MSGSKSVPTTHRTLHTLVTSGAPFTLQELEAAINEQAARTKEQEWTVAEILEEMHLNLRRGGMQQLGRNSFCFVPNIQWVELGRLEDWRERNTERKKARELFEKELGAKGHSALEKRAKERREEEQRAQEQKWKELEAKELKRTRQRKRRRSPSGQKQRTPGGKKRSPGRFQAESKFLSRGKLDVSLFS
ncbi:hypothetical protein L207DRAFT_527824 [Hyaloscypha variabilis F]|uniref:Uncharacterized protein n=1 Tax=Hyaloscypha variabilis (strain UAMH 11265 / GT02V1 / F) TaxID=1149755 RepID=A0A2J6RRL0_HYAVF|nr:hypothetical protein L207DRAFT_527824 [Hyaloscypha variabilis F]